MAGSSLRDIARQFPKFSKDSIQRHKRKCVQTQLQKRADQVNIRLADRLLDEMEELHTATRGLLTRLASENPGAALRAIGEARRNLALVARMVGRLEPKQEQDKRDGQMLTWEEFVVLYRSRKAA